MDRPPPVLCSPTPGSLPATQWQRYASERILLLMDDTYLASGFADVDASSNTDAFSDCLVLLDSLPYFREYKQHTYELLNLSNGTSVLEVGCGVGDDVVRMAELVSPNGRIVGVDASASMIERATARDDLPSGLLEFRQCDAKALPFGDSAFDRCRIDRVLQHISEPTVSISEMVRALKPGGLIVAYDNDWGTFSINSGNVEVTRIVQDLWTSSFTSPWIGRYLRPYFVQADLAEVVIYPSNSIICEFDIADKVYNLRQTLRRAVGNNMISEEEGAAWISELVELTKGGGFTCALTAYIAVGRKPPA